jgi:predicted enzyme related to lactoylglutathione lyase
MKIARQIVVLDAADLTAESTFWAGLLGGTVDAVDDVRAAHDEVISLGATLLKSTDDIESTEGYQVYADPAGHPFCLCWG